MFHTLRQSSFWQHLLPVLVPFVLFVLVAVWTIHYFDEQSKLAAQSRQAEHTVDQASAMIREELSRVTSDIAYLVQSNTLRRYVQSGDNAEQLTSDWQRFMLLNKYYDQIRFLDVKGMERVRVDFHNGQPLIIPPHALQNKSSRYYFKEAMALEPGQIYASPIDLNMENGAIVEPYQPTMRFAIQVTDHKSHVRGLLIANFSAHMLIQHLRNMSMAEKQGIYLINHQGYWLLGKSREVEWGFMFPTSTNPAIRINASYPDTWAKILKQPHGIDVNDDELIAFQTLSSNSSPINDGIKKLLPFNGSDFPWTVLTVMKRDSTSLWNYRYFDTSAWQGLIILLALLSIVAVSASSWRMALNLHQTQQAGQTAKAEVGKLQSILANLQDAIFLIDPDKVIVSCNPAAQRLFGLESSAIQQRRLREMLPLLPDNEQSANQCPVQSGFYSTEITLETDQTRISVDVMVYDIRNQGACHSLVIVHDARDRVDSEQRMRYLASHDLLTGLPNRFTLEEETRTILQNALRHDRQVALLHLDLDNFKQVIDIQGHRSGDEFLKRVAERLRLGIPDSCQIGRLGNDEFIILVPEINDQSEAAALATRIIRLLGEPFSVNSAKYHIGVSIGISFAPLDSESADTLFRHASTARHNAKAMGGNNFTIYDPVMNQEAKRLLTFENELRQARDEKQFLLYYQPKQALAGGQLSGVEALLRWEHPREGLLTPHAFIDKLEHSQELIIEVGYWVLEEACSTIVHWNASRLQQHQSPITMAVNFSSIQFRDPDMIHRIRDVLTRTRCEANWLELEVTESVLMDNLGSAERRLWALHETGISIAIDDFGTGYSSLAYLKKLPVRVLKIDRSFVAGLPKDKDDCAIVEATVTMAKHMGLRVVAEGVETEEQYAFLKTLEVEYVQGYLYARPMRKEKIQQQFLNSVVEAGDNRIVSLYPGKKV